MGHLLDVRSADAHEYAGKYAVTRALFYGPSFLYICFIMIFITFALYPDLYLSMAVCLGEARAS